MRRVLFRPQAARDLERLEDRDRDQVEEAIERFAQTGRLWELDAVVYKHRSKLPLRPERAGLQMEERTGEWYSETGKIPELIRLAGLEALHNRLGKPVCFYRRAGDKIAGVTGSGLD